MDKETFYRKLTEAMLGTHFLLRASDLAKTDLATDQDKVSSFARTVAQLAPTAIGAIHPFFDQEIVQQRLNEVHAWATLVFFKYVLAQPVLVAVVDADRLTPEQAINLAQRLDKVVLEMLDVTGRLGGAEVAGFQLSKGTRLSVTGIVLHVFFDPKAASTFLERAQKRCKIWHFFKKTWVLPWVVDLANQSVKSHRGLPFLPGVINSEHLRKAIFQ